MQLTIDIGFSDMVHVDQGQFAHTTSGKRFYRPRANAAHTYHGDVCQPYTLSQVGSEQTR
jgi:hypothetical protein